MSLSWISTAASLPLSGASILFVLDHREGSMNGTYNQGVFHSRWSNYDVDDVRLWRASNVGAVAPTTVAKPPRPISISKGALNWLFGRLKGHDAVISAPTPHEPIRSDSISVRRIDATCGIGRRADSNQMSS